jgi:hypothetical protein
MDDFITEFKAIARGREVVCFDPEFRQRSAGFEAMPEKERIKDAVYRAEIPGLVYNHLFRKVIPADFVFVMNVGGYVGMNTVGEIFGAAALSKTVIALERTFLAGAWPADLHEEPSIRPFVHAYCATPGALHRYVFNVDESDMLTPVLEGEGAL